MPWIWHSMCHSNLFWKCDLKGVTQWQGFFYFGSIIRVVQTNKFWLEICWLYCRCFFFLCCRCLIYSAGVWYILFAVSFMVFVIVIWWWIMQKLGVWDLNSCRQEPVVMRNKALFKVLENRCKSVTAQSTVDTTYCWNWKIFLLTEYSGFIWIMTFLIVFCQVLLVVLQFT